MPIGDDSREQRLAELHAMQVNSGRFWLEHDNATNLSRITESPDPKKPWESIPRSAWVSHDEALVIEERLLRGDNPD